MPDNIESHTIVLLREIREEIRDVREQTNLIPQIRADVTELQVAVAVLSADMKTVKKDVAELKETASIIEGRLVRIEKQMGYVKA
jgi:hypothetical protein